MTHLDKLLPVLRRTHVAIHNRAVTNFEKPQKTGLERERENRMDTVRLTSSSMLYSCNLNVCCVETGISLVSPMGFVNNSLRLFWQVHQLAYFGP